MFWHHKCPRIWTINCHPCTLSTISFEKKCFVLLRCTAIFACLSGLGLFFDFPDFTQQNYYSGPVGCQNQDRRKHLTRRFSQGSSKSILRHHPHRAQMVKPLLQSTHPTDPLEPCDALTLRADLNVSIADGIPNFLVDRPRRLHGRQLPRTFQNDRRSGSRQGWSQCLSPSLRKPRNLFNLNSSSYETLENQIIKSEP